MKIKKILLPFDGSDHSINAAKYALELATSFEAHVTIINCYELTGSMHSSEIPEDMIERIQLGIKSGSESILQKAASFFEQQGVEYETKSIAGAPGGVLADLAKSQQYDVIVIGSRGHSDFAGMLLGSVTHKVLNTIYCPVLVVP